VAFPCSSLPLPLRKMHAPPPGQYWPPGVHMPHSLFRFADNRILSLGPVNFPAFALYRTLRQHPPFNRFLWLCASFEGLFRLTSLFDLPDTFYSLACLPRSGGRFCCVVALSPARINSPWFLAPFIPGSRRWLHFSVSYHWLFFSRLKYSSFTSFWRRYWCHHLSVNQ